MLNLIFSSHFIPFGRWSTVAAGGCHGPMYAEGPFYAGKPDSSGYAEEPVNGPAYSDGPVNVGAPQSAHILSDGQQKNAQDELYDVSMNKGMTNLHKLMKKHSMAGG